MPRSRNPEAYPDLMWDIASAIARGTTNLHFELPSGREAIAFRQDFYAFRNALERASLSTSRTADSRVRYRDAWTAIATWKLYLEPTHTPKVRCTPEEWEYQMNRPTTLVLRDTNATDLTQSLSAQLAAQAPTPTTRATPTLPPESQEVKLHDLLDAAGFLPAEPPDGDTPPDGDST